MRFFVIFPAVWFCLLAAFSLPAHARGGGAANLMNSPGYQRAQKESRERYLSQYYGTQPQSVHRRKKKKHR